ncbi:MULTISPECIES: LuxR C-terminal-related transcriptional regulator [Arsenophonus]|uniref:helix-turn-helix transcriptional regulator n=1 Tax=Arsenophonus TaxID=637 RepID=UPI0015D8DEB7|nr:LuxR C-terminal-related transcriptional regulator [Arsenophonus endosymbiont of Apis mellifera]
MNMFDLNKFALYNEIFNELTLAQIKVFVLYSNAHKIDQIALELDISANTVCEHLKRIKEKYQLNSMVELKLLFNNRIQSYLLHFVSVYIVNGNNRSIKRSYADKKVCNLSPKIEGLHIFDSMS